jgi:hypothetical protein
MLMRPYIFVTALSSFLVLAGGPARAQTTAVGPYLATPAWDQKLQCDTLTTCLRFIVLSNWNSEAVLDRETGLVWERSPGVTPVLYNGARFLCSGTKVGNRMGWRLPTLHELTSLIDPSVSFLPAGHPFSNVQPAEYWSVTANVLLPGFGFVFEFFGTNEVFNRKRDTVEKAHVWCVRGGQGADAQ